MKVPPVVSRLFVVGLAFFPLLLAQGAAHADIFHCVDPGGVHVYRDSPCPNGARTAGVFVSAPVEQRAAQDDDSKNEYQRVVADQTEGLRRIQELEREVAELRAALQSMQVAAQATSAEPAYPSVAAQQPAYPTVAPEPAYPATLAPEPAYPAIPVVIVPGGCYGRACGPHRHPNHDGDDHRPVRHGPYDPHRQRPAELARGEPHDPGRKP